MKFWLFIAGVCWVILWLCIALAQMPQPGPGPIPQTGSLGNVFTESKAASDLGISSTCNTISTRALTPQVMTLSGATSGTVSATITASTSNTIVFYSPANSPGLTNWASGNWIFSLNVTTGNANLAWTNTCIFRASSGGSALHLTGSLTGQSTSLGTTGVKTMTVSGAAETTSATDRIEVVLVIANAAGTNQSFSYGTAGVSDTITTPLSGSGGGGLPPPPPPPPPYCTEMTHGAYFPSGYGLFDAVIGRSTHSIRYIKFKPSKTGTVTAFKWYNSAGSHAVWDSCTANYGSINPCANHGGQPQYENTVDPIYPLTFPTGWWPYANTCSTSYSGCYSGGTGGIISFTLLDASSNVLATGQVSHPNETYGFASVYTNNIVFLSTGADLISGNYYYMKMQDTDPNDSLHWWSFDNYTPYNNLTATGANALNLATTTIGGKANVADATVVNSIGGASDSNFQPIFLFQYTDGSCVGQGFAP